MGSKECLTPYSPLPDTTQYRVIYSLLSIQLFIYSVTLIFAMHNIIQYLIKQKRYKTWLVTLFYILSLTVLISRMCQFVFLFMLQRKTQEEDWAPFINFNLNTCGSDFRSFNIAFLIAVYAKICLGNF